MGVYWDVGAPLIAIAVTLLAMQIAVLLTNAIRRYDFRVFEDQSDADLEKEFPPLRCRPGIDRRGTTSVARTPFKMTGINLQIGPRRPTIIVVRSAACLVFGIPGTSRRSGPSRGMVGACADVLVTLRVDHRLA